MSNNTYSPYWRKNRQETFELLGKEKLFWKCDELIGEVVDVPPIKHCMYQQIEGCEWLLFTWGSVLVKFLRGFNGCAVAIEDEWNRPQFLTVSEVKDLFHNA
ncbi:MAG: hypothetical protein IJZ96_00710 [Lachnospiraceae bacterium]|nr:hypothetical protein [Lachnospiraceae bacterium]